MNYLLLIALVVAICIIIILYIKRKPVIPVPNTLTPRELYVKRLEYEVKKLEGELSGGGFESFFKKYTGSIILVLGFAGAVLAYVTQIKEYVGNINKKEVAQYTEIQIQAIEKLGNSDPWTQKAGIRVMEKMGVDAVDILIDRLNSLSKHDVKLVTNISIALNKIYGSIEKSNSTADIDVFNEELTTSINASIENFKNTNGKEESPVYNNYYLIKFLNSLNKNENIKALNGKMVEFLSQLPLVDPVRMDLLPQVK